jgi:hypothetical protein
MVVDTTRLSWIEDLNLAAGGHDGPEHGACVMEAVAYVAGEDWSDHPACASPVLGAFLRAWNDALDTDTRQWLKPYIPRIVGTAGDKAADERRAWMATDWLVRVCAPAFLELAGLPDDAERFRSLPELTSTAAAVKAQPTIEGGRKKAAAAWAAAGAAAWDAARAAAWAAAGDAAGDAAGAAARDAARDVLQPTVTDLQTSAFDLLERMLDAGDREKSVA